MADFSYLDELKVTSEDLSELTLYSIKLPNGKHPTLIGRHGGESNQAYANAVLKRQMKQQKVVKAGAMTVGMVQSNRDHDRQLYPVHVLTGWRDVCDAKNKDVPFAVDECADFVKALPDDIFDEVRNHFGDPMNFRNAADPEGAITKGKN